MAEKVRWDGQDVASAGRAPGAWVREPAADRKNSREIPVLQHLPKLKEEDKLVIPPDSLCSRVREFAPLPLLSPSQSLGHNPSLPVKNTNQGGVSLGRQHALGVRFAELRTASGVRCQEPCRAGRPPATCRREQLWDPGQRRTSLSCHNLIEFHAFLTPRRR